MPEEAKPAKKPAKKAAKAAPKQARLADPEDAHVAPKSRPLPEEPIVLGSHGKDVEWLQSIVGALADGVYDRRSEAALRRFQSKQGLAVDGVPGPKTWQRLNNEQ